MKRSGPIPRKTPMRRRRVDGPAVQHEPHPMAFREVAVSGADAAFLESHRFVVLGLTRGTYAGATSGVPVPKEDASQSGPYMRAAKALGYCMRCDKQRDGVGSIHFCHADEGKGQGIKTDVRRGWPGCPQCHEIVGRVLIKPVRRAIEYLLGVMTREAVSDAGTWPPGLALWKQER